MSDAALDAFARFKAERRARAIARKERRQGIYQVGVAAGRPLTERQKLALVEGVRAHKHQRTWRGLAERGLIDPKQPFMPPMPDDWPLTPEGKRVRDELLAERKAS
jgi:hypothetical protein